MPEISYIPVFVSGIAATIIGMIWYHPNVFGRAWMSLTGMSKKDAADAKRKGRASLMAAAFIGTLLMAGILDQVLALAGATSILQGTAYGFLIWLGFIAPVLLGAVLWENKPLKLYYIKAGHYLVVMVTTASILAVWG